MQSEDPRRVELTAALKAYTAACEARRAARARFKAAVAAYGPVDGEEPV